MGIEIPGSLRWVAELVVGENWPEGDETAMRRLADDWHDGAETANRIAGEGDVALRYALQEIRGETARSLSTRWDRTGSDLRGLAEQFEGLAAQLEDSALKTEHAKLAIIGALVALAAELIAAAAGTPLTFGLSEAVAVPAEAATATAIRLIVRKLALEVVDEMLVGAVENVAVEAFAQDIQILEGNRSGLDLSAIGREGGDGAIEGVSSGAFGHAGESAAEHVSTGAAKKLVESMANGVADGVSGTVTDALPWSEGDGPSVDGFVQDATSGFLQEGATREQR